MVTKIASHSHAERAAAGLAPCWESDEIAKDVETGITVPYLTQGGNDSQMVFVCWSEGPERPQRLYRQY